jgi:hypothetical protein
MNQEKEEFGIGRLTQAVYLCRDGVVEETARQIINEVNEYSVQSALTDVRSFLPSADTPFPLNRCQTW